MFKFLLSLLTSRSLAFGWAIAEINRDRFARQAAEACRRPGFTFP